MARRRTYLCQWQSGLNEGDTYVVGGSGVEYHLPDRLNYVAERTQDGDRDEVNAAAAGPPLRHFVHQSTTCVPAPCK